MLFSRYILLVALLALTACGFNPIYKVAKDGKQPADIVLSAIEIEPMSGRLGQQLHTSLEDLFNPQSIAAPAKYKLSIALTESNFPVVIEKNGQITRYNVIYTSNFTLKNSKTGAVIDSGIIKAVGGYDAVASRFSTFVAKNYTENITLKEMSEAYRMRLIATLYK